MLGIGVGPGDKMINPALSWEALVIVLGLLSNNNVVTGSTQRHGPKTVALS